jgi:hypothetical protein
MEVFVVVFVSYLLIRKADGEDYEGDDTVQTDSKPQENRDNSLFSWFF